MDTIIFIGTNKSGSSRDAIVAAKELNLYTILLTNNQKFIEQVNEFSDVDELIYIDITDIQRLREFINTVGNDFKKLKCIISFLESHVYTAALLSEEFGLNGFTAKSIQIMENKISTRHLLKKDTVTPYFDVYSKEMDMISFLERNKKKLPLIVKSPSSTGSKDVHLVETAESLRDRIISLENKYPDAPVLVEDFLNGDQFLIEVIVKDNKPTILAVLNQEFMKGNRFIVTGYSIMLEKCRDPSIVEIVETLTNAYQIEKGIFHIEMRFVNNEWKLVELNPRISGGAMNRIIQYYCGINAVKETIKLYLNREIDLTKKYERIVYTYYLTIGTRGRLIKVTGKNAAAVSPGVEEIYIKPRKGMYVMPPVSMGQRYGYVIASADSEEKAKEIAITAAKKIKFYIQTI